jgi:hypothetical protein
MPYEADKSGERFVSLSLAAGGAFLNGYRAPELHHGRFKIIRRV